MIKAIFFSTFDINEGPKVLHQVPQDSIVPSPASAQIPLFHFPSISSYIIPRHEFTSHLITLLASSHRILTFPICISSPTYPRNAYTFSFSLVLEEATPFATYLSPCRKLATLFRSLEEQSQFLSRDLSPPNSGKIYALCEILLEDLNNYCESMIPIDASNTLNIKLFPTYPPPPHVLPHHVPLSTVRLSALKDDNWDLTMLLILPHINGINSVRQIALAADADYKLVKKAIKHLLYYNTLLLLDVFSFSAIYAPTAEIPLFVENVDVQEECARYVTLPQSSNTNPSPDPTILTQLYLSLHQGQSLKAWSSEHTEVLSTTSIDIRRFITFGVIKGFLYRVHKYAITPKSTASRAKSENQAPIKDSTDLKPYLDGTHCFDEICTELQISERELMDRLKANSGGNVQIIHR